MQFVINNVITVLKGLGSYKLGDRKWQNLFRANFMEAQQNRADRGSQKEIE